MSLSGDDARPSNYGYQHLKKNASILNYGVHVWHRHKSCTNINAYLYCIQIYTHHKYKIVHRICISLVHSICIYMSLVHRICIYVSYILRRRWFSLVTQDHLYYGTWRLREVCIHIEIWSTCIILWTHIMYQKLCIGPTHIYCIASIHTKLTNTNWYINSYINLILKRGCHSLAM